MFRCIVVSFLLAMTVHPAFAGDVLANLKRTNSNGQVVVPDCVDVSPKRLKKMPKRYRCALGKLNNRRVVLCSWYREAIEAGESWRKQHTMRLAND